MSPRCGDGLLAPLGEMRLAGVFHNRQLMFLGKLENEVHLRRCAAHVDRQDAAGPGSDALFDLLGVDLERLAIGVHEHRQGVLQQYDVHRGDERVRRNEHLVLRSDVEGVKRRPKGGRPAGSGEAVACAEPAGPRLLELLDRAPPRTVPLQRPQDRHPDLLVALTDDRPAGERFLPDRPAAEHGRLVPQG